MMRTIAAIGASAVLAVALLVSSVSLACESKTCRADFDCDPHQICMQWQNRSSTCEWPGANPIMPVARRSEVKSCNSDAECPDGWRCEKRAQSDDMTVSSAVCAPDPRGRITY